MAANKLWVFWFVNASFLISGVTQTLLAFHFDQIGFAKDSSNFINAMGNPVGQFLFAAPSLQLWRNWDQKLLLSILPIVVCELGCNLFSQIAIGRIGSGMYQVVYAFVVVMNAIPGHFCLGKKLNAGQWFSVLLIFLSVALAAVAQLRLKGVDVGQELIGIFAALLATVFVSVVYVAANWLLEKPWDRPAPKPLVMAQMLGTIETTIIGVYFCSYVIPRWDTIVAGNMQPGYSTEQCALLYAIYLVVCGVHQYAFYYSCSLGPTGAVTAGINKCVQTAVLFFLSHLLYCGESKSQCLSDLKILGTFGVCSGVLLYGWFAAKKAAVALESESPAVSLHEQLDAGTR